MSDNWITLIPVDPRFIPDEEKLAQALDRFHAIAPDAEEIEVQVLETIQFFDCGGNFDQVHCPSCKAVVDIDWWQSRVDEDYRHGSFMLASYATPCCGANHTLHDLDYEWPQGFGRFALDAMNPDIGKLDDRHRIEFEEILGTKLRVIYQHI